MEQAFEYEGCAKGPGCGEKAGEGPRLVNGGTVKEGGRNRRPQRLLGLSRGPDCISWGPLAEGSPCKDLEAGEDGHPRS